MSLTIVSVFDLFKIGIGPSSSHTMGPMTAAQHFVAALRDDGRLPQVSHLTVELYGSLALTGKGHATDTAVCLGLAGWLPAQVDPDLAATSIASLRRNGELLLAGMQRIDFRMERDIHWRCQESLPFHPNALTLHAWGVGGAAVHQATFYSVGGGFVVTQAQAEAQLSGRPLPAPTNSNAAAVPFPYANAAELLDIAEREQLGIAELTLRNECALRTPQEVGDGLERIWAAMHACIERGLHQEGTLPGGLNVKRRAAKLRAALEQRSAGRSADPLTAMDWINAWALAVNEENAAGGKVVTAPTNGAAGDTPGVLP